MDNKTSQDAGYEFSNSWFDDNARATWERLIPAIRPARILEIGSYEGASACFMVDTLSAVQRLEIHCVDSWSEPAETETPMALVEARFRRNMHAAIARADHQVELHVHKRNSLDALATLIAQGRRNTFDFVYVDGSHVASDVLADGILAFSLLRVGGVLVFDDYLWTDDRRYGRDVLRSPKLAIDTFVNIHFRELAILFAPFRQIYLLKQAPVPPPMPMPEACPPLVAVC